MSDFRTQFGPSIVEHWEANWPEKTEELRKERRLVREADACANGAITFLLDALQNGESFEKASKHAEAYWWWPPNIHRQR